MGIARIKICKQRHLLLLFFFTSLLSSAQGGFRNRYFIDSSYSAVSRNAIEAPNGNLIVIGLSRDTVGNSVISRLTVVGSDKSGNFLWRKSCGSKNFYYLNDFIRGAVCKDETGFYHALTARDSKTSKDVGVLIKFDYNGDTLWQKIFRSDTTEWIVFFGVCKGVDNSILITGRCENYGKNANTSCLLIKTDLDGYELWQKRVSKPPPKYMSGVGVLQHSVSKKIVVVGSQQVINAMDGGTGSCVLIFDSIGNLEFNSTFNNTEGRGFYSVIELKDGNLLTSGKWYNSPNGWSDTYEHLVVKFSDSGTIIWKSQYGLPHFYNGLDCPVELSNGDIFLTGQRVYEIDSDNGYVKICLHRLDKNGNLLWVKDIGDAHEPFEEQLAFSMQPTSDKGFLLSVFILYMKPPQPFAIIKIDSMGCDTLEAYCRTIPLGLGENAPGETSRIKIFPNPYTGGNLTIENENSEEPCELEIQDINGRIVKRLLIVSGTDKIDASELDDGIYLISVFDKSGFRQQQKLVVLK